MKKSLPPDEMKTLNSKPKIPKYSNLSEVIARRQIVATWRKRHCKHCCVKFQPPLIDLILKYVKIKVLSAKSAFETVVIGLKSPNFMLTVITWWSAIFVFTAFWITADMKMLT